MKIDRVRRVILSLVLTVVSCFALFVLSHPLQESGVKRPLTSPDSWVSTSMVRDYLSPISQFKLETHTSRFHSSGGLADLCFFSSTAGLYLRRFCESTHCLSNAPLQNKLWLVYCSLII